MMDGRKKKFIKELLEKPRLRRESGLYVVDGPKMCAEIPEELIEEIYISETFLSQETDEALSRLIRGRGSQIVSEKEMKQLSDTVTPQGIMALCRQKRPRGLKDIIEGLKGKDRPGLLLGLECLQDPGNMGTILRSAEAAGADGIICDRGCADVYAPKVVRSTMGAIFRLPVLSVDDLKPACRSLKEEGFEVLAAHLHAEREYDKADLCLPSLILIGNESRGLTEELSSEATSLIKIPMLGKTESLNAAVAASVLLFEAARQRREANGSRK